MVARILGMLCLLVLAAPPQLAQAVTPESPEVQKVIDKALVYLENSPSDNRLGGKCLVALALLKADRPHEHPKVVEALEACNSVTRQEAEAIQTDIYSTGIAVIFLCTLDAYENKAAIEKLLKSLELRQKPHGGWGYPQQATGDTSMTQYAVLSSWEAQQSGEKIPPAIVEKVSNWLIRTQDPSGGWGYQGVDPGDYTPVAQTPVRLSLAAAGLGSTFICADMLGIIEFKSQDDDDLPEALKLVRDPNAPQPGGGVVDPRRLQTAVDKGERWIAENFKPDPPGATHYYLYALERAMSFSEFAKGRIQKEPRWYNEGFKFLAGTQREDGSWEGHHTDVVDSAFAVLFLLRSTRKSIEKYKNFGEGTLVGGRGLPRNLGEVKLQRGRIVDPTLATGAEDLVQILSDPTHPDFDYLAENPEALVLSPDAAERETQVARLERLTRGGSPEARRAAVKALGRSDQLEVVPTLIYALSDGDPGVVRAAHEALCLVSRNLEGFGVPDPKNPQKLLETTKKWKSWYVAIRPDAVFPEVTE